MAVGADAAEEEVDAADFADTLLVGCTLGFEVGGVAVEDMDVVRLHIDVLKEVATHEGVVALGVILGQADVFVHVEGDDVAEGYSALLAQLDEPFVGADGRRASGQTQDEGTLGRGRGAMNARSDVVRRPAGHGFVGGLDKQTHD